MLEQARAAVAVPLAIVVVGLGAAVVAWQVGQVPTRWLMAGLACGMVVPILVGARRAQVAATAVHRVQAAQLHSIAGAVGAVEKSVLWTADELCRGGRPPVPHGVPPQEGADPATEIAVLLGQVQVQAAASLIRVHDESQSALLLEMLRHLSRREHAIVGRALEALTELQELTDDPELLDVVYRIDHLVTRMRRLVESKAVLGGESLRSVRRPVSVVTVLRGAVSEVVQYPRVTVAAGTVGAELGLPGHVGPDLTHLVAELIENATEFSDPATRVQVRAQQVAAGLAVEVEDRAIPMSPELRARMNQLLAAPDEADVGVQVRDGRIGLLTAATIARGHGMSVSLSENPTGGTTALVVVPARHLVAIPSCGSVPPAAAGPGPAARRPSAAAAPPWAEPLTEVGCAPPAHTAADSAGRQSGAPLLPQRMPGQVFNPPVGERPQTPATAGRPHLAAAFRSGMHAARPQENAAPSAQASGPAESPAAHP